MDELGWTHFSSFTTGNLGSSVPMPSSAARLSMPTKSSSVTWFAPAHPSSIHSTRRPDHGPVLVAAGLILCQRPPVAWQLVERRETAALALLEGKGVLPHRSLRVSGRKARLNASAAYLDAKGSKGIAHGRSRGRAPVGRQGLALPGQQTVHHVAVRTLPARARLLEGQEASAPT